MKLIIMCETCQMFFRTNWKNTNPYTYFETIFLLWSLNICMYISLDVLRKCFMQCIFLQFRFLNSTKSTYTCTWYNTVYPEPINSSVVEVWAIKHLYAYMLYLLWWLCVDERPPSWTYEWCLLQKLSLSGWYRLFTVKNH